MHICLTLNQSLYLEIILSLNITPAHKIQILIILIHIHSHFTTWFTGLLNGSLYFKWSDRSIRETDLTLFLSTWFFLKLPTKANVLTLYHVPQSIVEIQRLGRSNDRSIWILSQFQESHIILIKEKYSGSIVHMHIKYASIHKVSSQILKVEFTNPSKYFAKICPLSVDPKYLVVNPLEEIKVYMCLL